MILPTAVTMLAWAPGWMEITIVLLAALLLFGGKKLPELARGLGKGMRQFKEELSGAKKGLDDITSDITDESDTSENNAQAAESTKNDEKSDEKG